MAPKHQELLSQANVSASKDARVLSLINRRLSPPLPAVRSLQTRALAPAKDAVRPRP